MPTRAVERPKRGLPKAQLSSSTCTRQPCACAHARARRNLRCIHNDHVQEHFSRPKSHVAIYGSRQSLQAQSRNCRERTFRVDVERVVHVQRGESKRKNTGSVIGRSSIDRARTETLSLKASCREKANISPQIENIFFRTHRSNFDDLRFAINT